MIADVLSPGAYLDAVRRIYSEQGMAFELNAPATEESIAALGSGVPRWLAELWRIADGGPSDASVFTRPNFLTGFDFLSTAQSLRLRDRLQGLASQYEGYEQDDPRDSRIRGGWFLPAWLPFAAWESSAMVLFVDCDPAAEGTKGQIIAFVHDPDEVTYIAANGSVYLASSLAWLQEQAEDFVVEPY